MYDAAKMPFLYSYPRRWCHISETHLLLFLLSEFSLSVEVVSSILSVIPCSSYLSCVSLIVNFVVQLVYFRLPVLSSLDSSLHPYPQHSPLDTLFWILLRINQSGTTSKKTQRSDFAKDHLGLKTLSMFVLMTRT